MDEQIKLYLLKSVKTLNHNFTLVVILSLTSIFILTNEAFILLGLAGVIVTPVIYGRFFEISWRTNHSTYLQLFNQHCLNFFVVIIILRSPYLVFSRLLNRDSDFLFLSFLEAIALVLGIYAIPLVFITREKIFSVASGIRCLWLNFQFSLPLVLLTLLIVFIKNVSLIFAISFFTNSHAAIFAIVFIQNIILNYIALSVFMTATILFLNKTEFQKFLKP